MFFETLSSMDMVTAIIGLYPLICGIATLVTGQIYGNGKLEERFTESSINAARPFVAIGMIIIGIGVLVFGILGAESLGIDSTLRRIVVIAGVVIGGFIYVLGYRKFDRK